MKKFEILPNNPYESIQEHVIRDTPSNLQPKFIKVIELEKRLRAIMDDKYTPVDERRVLYQNVLQQYLKEYGDITQSNAPSNEGRDNMINHGTLNTIATATTNDSNEDIITRILPVTTRSKGRVLYNALKRIQGIKWDTKGTLSIDGVAYPNSNITDIVVDLVKKWGREPPYSWQMLKNKLQDVNFPLSTIQNPHRLKDFATSSSYTLYNREPTHTENSLKRAASQDLETYSTRRKKKNPARTRTSRPYPSPGSAVKWLKF